MKSRSILLGLLLAGAAGSALTAGPRRSPLAKQALAADRKSDSPALRLWVECEGKPFAPGDMFRTGQTVRLHCRANMPLWLVVYRLGAPADRRRVYPQRLDQYAAGLAPDASHAIPSEGTLTFGAHPTSQTFVVAFSRRPIALAERLHRLHEQLCREHGTEKLETLVHRRVVAGDAPADDPVARLAQLRRRLVALLEKALQRPDLLVHEELAAAASAAGADETTAADGPGLYVAASMLAGEEVAAVTLSLVSQAPADQRDAKVRAKDIFYSPAPSAHDNVMVTGKGIRYTILAGGFRPVTPSHEFRSGDRFLVKLDTNADLYCRVFTELPGAGIIQLYPTGQELLLVRRGQARTIPEGMYFKFDNVPGLERLTLVFSAKPFGSFEHRPAPVPGLTVGQQGLYHKLYTSGPLAAARRLTETQSKDIHYVEDPKPGTETGVYVVDTRPGDNKPVVVDIVLVHRQASLGARLP